MAARLETAPRSCAASAASSPAASTAATYVVAKSGNDELKKQMLRVINGATMIGSAACLSQFDEDKDFNNSSFAKPFKYGNMALQIGIGAALLKDGLGKKRPRWPWPKNNNTAMLSPCLTQSTETGLEMSVPAAHLTLESAVTIPYSTPSPYPARASPSIR